MTELEQYRFIKAAKVLKNGVPAATFARTSSGGTVFSYLPGYAGPPIAFSLPIEKIPVETLGGALPPFFAGLLPEGHRLSVLRRAIKTSADDELSLLLAIGHDLPGDVQVIAESETPSENTARITQPTSTLSFRELTESVDRTGIAGVQTKASASMINTPVSTSTEHAILKIDPAEYPHLVLNEALHLQQARMLKIPVSDHRIVHDRDGIPGLWVTRYDRIGDQRLAMEDATQVMGIYPSKKYSVETEDVVHALVSRCAAPMIATRNLYLQFLYAWLTGNGDLHAKNVSVLRSTNGRWEIAPMRCTTFLVQLCTAISVLHSQSVGEHESYEETIGSNSRPISAFQFLPQKAASN